MPTFHRFSLYLVAIALILSSLARITQPMATGAGLSVAPVTGPVQLPYPHTPPPGGSYSPELSTSNVIAPRVARAIATTSPRISTTSLSTVPSRAASSQADHPVYVYHALMTSNSSLRTIAPFVNRIGTPTAWNAAANNPSIQPIIAVVDTGFDLDHADFAGRLLPGYDFIHNDTNPQAGRDNPAGAAVTHGTLTAGLAALMDPAARIMPVQALDDNGNGDTNTVASAMQYAIDHGASIISLSLGAGSDDVYLRNVINNAIGAGILVVAAAGNDGCNCMLYPAAYPEVLSVGASDGSNAVANFSSYGSNLDIMAPGTGFDVCSDEFDTSSPTTATTCAYDGTSLSTPIVAGTAALMLNQDPNVSPSDLIRFLVTTATKTTAMAGQNRTLREGYGIVNPYAALVAASLARPVGSFTNKAAVSLGSTDPLVSPELVSTCRGLPGATCTITLSGPGNATATLGSQVLDTEGSTLTAWNAATLGLTPGQWQLTASLMAFGQTSISPVYIITVSP